MVTNNQYLGALERPYPASCYCDATKRGKANFCISSRFFGRTNLPEACSYDEYIYIIKLSSRAGKKGITWLVGGRLHARPQRLPRVQAVNKLGVKQQ